MLFSRRTERSSSASPKPSTLASRKRACARTRRNARTPKRAPTPKGDLRDPKGPRFDPLASRVSPRGRGGRHAGGREGKREKREGQSEDLSDHEGLLSVSGPFSASGRCASFGRRLAFWRRGSMVSARRSKSAPFVARRASRSAVVNSTPQAAS